MQRIAGELWVDAHVRALLIRDMSEAQRLGFPCSPTVRVNGQDVEPGANRAETSLSCRLYRIGDRFASQPAESWIRNALRRAVEEGPQSS